MHGYAGGTSLRENYEPGTFSLNGNVPTWTRPLAKVRLVLDSSMGEPAVETALYSHEWYSGNEGQHNYIDGNVVAATDLTFLAVVYPQKSAEEFPVITILDSGADTASISVVGDGRNDFAFSRISGSEITLSPVGFGTIVTDAMFLWIGLDSEGSVSNAIIKSGSKLQINGDTPENLLIID